MLILTFMLLYDTDIKMWCPDSLPAPQGKMGCPAAEWVPSEAGQPLSSLGLSGATELTPLKVTPLPRAAHSPDGAKWGYKECSRGIFTRRGASLAGNPGVRAPTFVCLEHSLTFSVPSSFLFLLSQLLVPNHILRPKLRLSICSQRT